MLSAYVALRLRRMRAARATGTAGAGGAAGTASGVGAGVGAIAGTAAAGAGGAAGTASGVGVGVGVGAIAGTAAAGGASTIAASASTIAASDDEAALSAAAAWRARLRSIAAATALRSCTVASTAARAVRLGLAGGGLVGALGALLYRQNRQPSACLARTGHVERDEDVGAAVDASDGGHAALELAHVRLPLCRHPAAALLDIAAHLDQLEEEGGPLEATSGDTSTLHLT